MTSDESVAWISENTCQSKHTQYIIQRISGYFYNENALYKSMFYLLTFTDLIN